MRIIECGRSILVWRKREKEREKARVLREQIKNETPLEKARRSHKNRSEAQTRRREKEFLQRQRGEH